MIVLEFARRRFFGQNDVTAVASQPISARFPQVCNSLEKA